MSHEKARIALDTATDLVERLWPATRDDKVEKVRLLIELAEAEIRLAYAQQPTPKRSAVASDGCVW